MILVWLPPEMLREIPKYALSADFAALAERLSPKPLDCAELKPKSICLRITAVDKPHH